MLSVVALICNAKIDYSSATDSVPLDPVSLLLQHSFRISHLSHVMSLKTFSHLIIFKKIQEVLL
jgi:hypothetical protein